jgi:hypothetical protein
VSRTDGYTWECPSKLEIPGVDFTATAGRVIEDEAGAILMPVAGTSGGESVRRAKVVRSTDGGRTWTGFGAIGCDDISFYEPRILALPGNRVLAMMRTRDRNFFAAASGDGGATWSGPKETPIWCGGSSAGDLLLLKDGRVLCTYGHRRPPFGVRACISEDGGETWDIERETVITDEGLDRDMGYPSSEQLDDGSILTVFYWHLEDGVRYLVSQRWEAK